MHRVVSKKWDSSDKMYDAVRCLYDEEKENIYPDEAFSELSSDYKLVKANFGVRKFLRRNYH